MPIIASDTPANQATDLNEKLKANGYEKTWGPDNQHNENKTSQGTHAYDSDKARLYVTYDDKKQIVAWEHQPNASQENRTFQKGTSEQSLAQKVPEFSTTAAPAQAQTQAHATSPAEEKLKTEVLNTHSETIAKRQLIETLQEKNMPAYQPGENTKVVLERATQGAREELATMQKQNPGASYSEMLERVKPEEKQQIAQNKGQAQAMAV